MSHIDPVDLEQLFKLSVDLLCVFGLEGEILAVNAACVSALGYTEAELVGRSVFSLVHPDDVEKTLAQVKSTAGGSTTVLLEIREVTAAGEVRWFQWSARADPKHGRIYASGRDVTNQRGDRERLQRYADLLERTQRELREALEELTRVAGIDQLTGLMNRRAFEARATDELSRGPRSQRPLGLVMLDIDHFKTINDSHGHPMGDVVLREVARRLEAARRQYRRRRPLGRRRVHRPLARQSPGRGPCSRRALRGGCRRKADSSGRCGRGREDIGRGRLERRAGGGQLHGDRRDGQSRPLAREAERPGSDRARRGVESSCGSEGPPLSQPPRPTICPSTTQLRTRPVRAAQAATLAGRLPSKTRCGDVVVCPAGERVHEPGSVSGGS